MVVWAPSVWGPGRAIDNAREASRLLAEQRREREEVATYLAEAREAASVPEPRAAEG